MMRRKWNPNLEILERVVGRLGPIADELVFFGGCAVGLLLTDPVAPPVRFMQEVQVIAEAASLADYRRLVERLRARGFRDEKGPKSPVWRWRLDEVSLDVMPTDAALLGFGSRWYPAALKSATRLPLPSGTTIPVVSAPLFMATKLAAFADRGRGDYAASQDLEDVVAVLDGRPELLDEVAQAPAEVRRFMCAEFQRLCKEARFISALAGHLPDDQASQARVPLLRTRIGRITELA